MNIQAIFQLKYHSLCCLSICESEETEEKPKSQKKANESRNQISSLSLILIFYNPCIFNKSWKVFSI